MNKSIKQLIYARQKVVLMIILVGLIALGSIAYFVPMGQNEVSVTKIDKQKVIDNSGNQIEIGLKTTLHGYIALLDPQNQTLTKMNFAMVQYGNSSVKYFEAFFQYEVQPIGFSFSNASFRASLKEDIQFVRMDTNDTIWSFSNILPVDSNNLSFIPNILAVNYSHVIDIVPIFQPIQVNTSVTIAVLYTMTANVTVFYPDAPTGILSNSTMVGTNPENPLRFKIYTDTVSTNGSNDHNDDYYKIPPDGITDGNWVTDDGNTGTVHVVPIRRDIKIYSLFGGEGSTFLIMAIAILFIGAYIYMTIPKNKTKRFKQRKRRR